MENLIVTAKHLRILRQTEDVCVPGITAWARAHGLDIREFLRDGWPAQMLLDTDLEVAKRLVAIAIKCQEEEEAHGRG